jgi:two-component system, LytTR family, sensor kinase
METARSDPDRPGLSQPRWPALLTYACLVVTPLAWSTVAFVFIGMNAAGRSLSFERAMLAGLPDWYFWAAFTPVVFWLGQRYRLERGRWARAASVHLVAGTAVALAEIFLVVLFNRSVGVPSFAGEFHDVFLRLVLQYFHFHFIIYWVIVLAAHALRYYGSLRERELETTRLRAELVQAQLSALQLQLHPHFFFNTLHTISTLVREGRQEPATNTIALLGNLFRQTLGTAARNEVPLQEELEFLRSYLAIEQMRFCDRLEVRLDIAADTLEARVPSLALQPLVENAIRHGIARDPRARVVELRTRRVNGTLRIDIRNDGPRFDPRRLAGGGVGLGNVKARLGRLYGEGFRLEVLPGDPGGAVVELEIPWRTA